MNAASIFRLLLLSLLLGGMASGQAAAQQPQQVVPCTPQPSTNNFNVICINQGYPATGNAGYPANATPLVGTFGPAADTSSASASLNPLTGQYAYLCGFEVNGLGATSATTVSPLSSNVVGPNTLNFIGAYTFAAGATVANTPLVRNYMPCVRAATAGSALSITVPGAAGNTSTNIQLWGYSQ